MQTDKLDNYLRTYRKKLGLTQREVSFLLGCHGGAKVSRYERTGRIPDLKTIFAFEAIFRKPARAPNTGSPRPWCGPFLNSW